MNQTTEKQATPPLSVRPIPRRGIPGVPGVILFVLLALSALIIPLSVSVLTGNTFLTLPLAEGISLVYLVLLVFYLGRTAKLSGGTSRGLTPLLILTGFLSYGIFGTLIPAVIAAALIFVIGEGAVLLATADRLRGFLFFLIPLAVFLLAFLLCEGLDMALLSLLPFPAVITLAMGTRSSADKETGLTRVGVICATSLAFGLTLAGLLAWSLYRVYGALNMAVFSELTEALRSALKEYLMSYTISYGDTVLTPLAGKEAEVLNVVNSTINTLPGTLIVMFNVVAALSQMLTFSGLHAYGFGESVTGRVRDFRLSAVSAVVFLLSWIVALVAVGENNASTMAGTVAENFFIILTPGLALAGLFRFMRGIARRGARMGCGFFIIVLLIPCLILYVPTVAALYETVSLIFGPMFAKLRSKRKDDRSDDSFTGSSDADRPAPKPKSNKPMTDEERFEQYCKEQEERRRREENDQHKDDP